VERAGDGAEFFFHVRGLDCPEDSIEASAVVTFDEAEQPDGRWRAIGVQVVE
jgi:hypothetical protein